MKHAAVLTVAWAVLAVAVPIVANWRDVGLSPMPDTVSAGPRNQSVIASTIVLGPAEAGIQLREGMASLTLDKGARLTGAESLALIKAGRARIGLDGVAIEIGKRATDPVAPTATYAPDHPGADSIVPADGESGDPLLHALAALEAEALILKDAQIAVHLPGGRIERLAAASGEVVLNRKRGLVAAKLKGTWRGQPATADVSLSLNPADRQQPTRLPLKLKLETAAATFAFDGTTVAQPGGALAGQVDVAIRDLRRTARMLDAPWGDGPGLKTASLKGPMQWVDRAIAIPEATVTLDGNTARGAINVSLNASRPLFAGTLDVPSLDLTPYCCDTGHHMPDLAGFLAAWSVLPRELAGPVALHFDADVRLSAKKVTLGSLQLDTAAVSIGLKDGKVNANIAEFEHGGGTGMAKIGADLAAPKPELSLRSSLKGAELSPAMQAVFGAAVVQGVGNLTAEVTTSGHERAEMVSGLRGQLAIELPDGGRLGLDLKALEAAATAGSAVSGWLGAERGTTAFDKFRASFEIEGGIMSSRGVNGFVGDRAWSMIGAINAPARRLDLIVRSNKVLAAAQSAVAGGSGERETSINGNWSTPRVRSLSYTLGPRAQTLPFGFSLDLR